MNLINKILLRLFTSVTLTSAFCLMLPNLLYAGGEGQVEAEGYAIILDNRKDVARESALNNAFRKAIEQALGIMVEAETLIKNFELLNDRVYSKSSGYIKKYTVISEKIEDNTFRIKIKALVSKRKIERDLDDIGILIKKAGKPRILILVSERNVLSDKSSYWWGGGEAVSMGVVENTLMQKFMEKGFNFIDRQVILQGIKEDPSIARNLSDNLTNEMALKLASEGEAEVVIIGQAIVKAGPPIMGTNLRSCQANISARAVNADSGETIASVSASAVAAHVDTLTGGSEAFKKAAGEISEKLITQILAKWEKCVTGTHMVKLVVYGLRFEKVKAFKDFIKNQIEDVEEIYDRSYKEGIAKLDIDVKESLQAIAEELNNKEFNGSLLEVTSFTSNVIHIKFKSR